MLFGKKKRKPLCKDDFKPVAGSFAHAAGLGIASGEICYLNLEEENLTIFGGGTRFALSVEKITSISTKYDTEVQKQLVSSTGGAIAGAMLFGVPGALIGGKVKEKEITTYNNFMCISYKKDDGIACILFAIKAPSDALPFITQFGLLRAGRETPTVEL